MVVLPGNPFFGGDIGPGKEVREYFYIVTGSFEHRFKESPSFRGQPLRIKNPLWKSRSHKIDIDIGAGFSVVSKMEFTGVDVSADHRAFNRMGG